MNAKFKNERHLRVSDTIRPEEWILVFRVFVLNVTVVLRPPFTFNFIVTRARLSTSTVPIGFPLGE